MRLYLAAAFDRRRELVRYAAALRLLGHAVVSAWIDTPCEDDAALTAEQLRGWALKDRAEIAAADCVVHFTGYGDRGGRHVELGLALGMGVRSILVGPRENVFHYLEEIPRCEDVLDLMLYIGRG